METLQNIKLDLFKTANHLDELSRALTGHASFIEGRGSSESKIDLKTHIKSIDGVAEDLRYVASKIRDKE